MRMADMVGEEGIEVTGPEKLLAVLLALFLAVGTVWAYFEVDDIVSDSGRSDRAYLYDRQQAQENLDPGARLALQQYRDALTDQQEAKRHLRLAERQMIVAREAYRTELDADRPAEAAEAAYGEATQVLAEAQAGLERSRAEVQALRPAAIAAQQAVDAEQKRLFRESRERADSNNLTVFLIRLGLLVFLLGLGLVLLKRGRERLGRWQLVPGAVLAAAAVLAVVMAVDYGNDVFDWRDVGPGIVSLVGIALTLTTLVLVQRSIARRLPQRRVRRGLCPFCGFPAGQGTHCEGCGRLTRSVCTTCAQPRRVGTRHCSNCGAG